MTNQRLSLCHMTGTMAIYGRCMEIPDALDVVRYSQSTEEAVACTATFLIIFLNTTVFHNSTARQRYILLRSIDSCLETDDKYSRSFAMLANRSEN